MRLITRKYGTKFSGQEGSGMALELIEMSAQIINSGFVSNRKGNLYQFIMHG